MQTARLACCCALSVASAAFAQCPAHWIPGLGLHNGVYALMSYNNDLIAGGDMFMSSQQGDSIARWDGAAWNSMGPGIAGEVHSLSQFQADLVAAGRFTSVGGVTVNNIAHWNGSTWQPFAGGLSGAPVGMVNATCIYNNDLIAAGNFTFSGTNLNHISVMGIARWTGVQWAPLGQGLNSFGSYGVLALTVFNGDLIAAGDFSEIGAVPSHGIARWNGTAWFAMGSGMNNAVRALTVYNGQLIAAGDFTTAGGVATATRVASWDGATWQPMGGGLSNGVHSLTVYQGQLIAGGEFSLLSVPSYGTLVRWDGSSWQHMGNPKPDASTLAMTTWRSQLIAGGSFHHVGYQNAEYWARWYAPSPDFNHDGALGTDQDITDFFSCLGGSCCATCDSADFDGNGDVGTDQDIDAFFRVLAGSC